MKVRTLISTVLILIVLTACAGRQAQPSANGAEVPTPTPNADAPVGGGSLTVYVSSLPASLLPSEKSAEALTAALYGNLLRYGEDGKVYGVMVDGIESSDPSTWVMRMRDYVKFTDGTPIDANSVKTNWMWHADQANSSQAYDLASQIASLEVVDPKTLKITLKAPNDKFALDVTNSQLNTMASPKSMGMKDVFAKRPFAAGPFMVSEWIPNDHLTLVRNPYYYLKDHPYVRELKFLLQADVQQKITALKSGVPVMVQVTSADEAAKYTEQGLAVSGPSGGTQWVANELVKGLKVWGQGYYNPEEIWLVQSK